MKKTVTEESINALLKRIEDAGEAESEYVGYKTAIKLLKELKGILNDNKDDKILEWALQRWISNQKIVGHSDEVTRQTKTLLKDFNNIINDNKD